MSITCRLAEPADLNTVKSIQESCLPFERYDDSLFKKLLHSTFVALADSTIVGYVIMCKKKAKTDIDKLFAKTVDGVLSIGCVFSFGVLYTHRKIGVGLKLLNYALENALPGYNITLTVRVSNSSAISLYKKCKFIEHSKLDNYYTMSTNGTPEDAIVMIRS